MKYKKMMAKLAKRCMKKSAKRAEKAYRKMLVEAPLGPTQDRVTLHAIWLELAQTEAECAVARMKATIRELIQKRTPKKKLWGGPLATAAAALPPMVDLSSTRKN